jgi:hypothetical protein
MGVQAVNPLLIATLAEGVVVLGIFVLVVLYLRVLV